MKSLLAVLCVLSMSASAFAVDAAPPAEKVLVLPFDAVNSAQQQKWIAQGVQQNLLTQLASMKSLQAASNTSAAADAAAAIDAAHSAGAKYVVFGSYQLNNDEIRFTGQVVEASTGNVVGGLKTTGSMRDLFAVEDQLSAQMQTALTPAPQPMPVVSTTPMPATQPSVPTLARVINSHRVYAWDRDDETDFGAHDRYLYYRSDYYNRRLWDNYQAYWNSYFSYNAIPGLGFPFNNNITLIQPTNPDPRNQSRPLPSAVGNAPGPIQTLQGPPSNPVMNGQPLPPQP